MKIVKALIVMIVICGIAGLFSYLVVDSFLPGCLLSGVVLATWTLIAPDLMIDYFSRFPLFK